MNMQVSVLLVDDHVMVRKGLASLLSSYEDFCLAGEAEDGEIIPEVERVAHQRINSRRVQARRHLGMRVASRGVLGHEADGEGAQGQPAQGNGEADERPQLGFKMAALQILERRQTHGQQRHRQQRQEAAVAKQPQAGRLVLGGHSHKGFLNSRP